MNMRSKKNATSEQTLSLSAELKLELDKRLAWALANPAHGRTIEEIAKEIGVVL
jgi:hypothetical protein